MNNASARTGARLKLAVTTAAIACLFAVSSASTASAAYPTKVSAMGDSITQAAMTCPLLLSCPANSWASGTNTSVNSILRRLKAIKPTATGYNNAVSGARVADLVGQATTTISQKPQLVSVFIGANDACGAFGSPTSPASFTASFQQVITKLKGGLPSTTKIVVASVPNLYYLYSLFKNDIGAQIAWNTTRFCPQMTAAPDEATRQATLQRVIAYNSAMAGICAATPSCIWDNNKVFNYPFLKSEIGTIDYFHPSIAGQATIAREAWPLVPNTF